jgi:hypothetical protein
MTMRTLKPQRTLKILMQNKQVHPIQWREYLLFMQRAGSRFVKRSRKMLDNWR